MKRNLSSNRYAFIDEDVNQRNKMSPSSWSVPMNSIGHWRTSLL